MNSWQQAVAKLGIISSFGTFNLITLRQLKAHVSQDTEYDDEMLEEKRAQASYLILDYLKLDVNDTGFNWCDLFGEPTDKIPGVVVAATLMAAAAMYENRDGSDEQKAPAVLSKSVVDMLMRQRMLTMA